MKAADTLRMARHLWPELKWCYPEDSPTWGVYTMGVANAREWFSPSTCLNDCALALEVIAERGLQGEYMKALDVELSGLPQKNWYDAIDAWSIHIASAAQRAAAILAVVDEQLESQEGGGV